jgi:catechol 2,3-dioxygenase-like lactoylglutathione lyase family enzyme
LDHCYTASALSTSIDHLVIDVRDRIDEAERTYRALGFNLTPRGFHTLGSVNHLAVFAGPYLELLGTGDSQKRADIAAFPEGLNGFVFAADDVELLHRGLIERGVPALAPVSFSRPVNVAGELRDASFDVVRLGPGASPFGRFYFCHHRTPELVWIPAAQHHPNGVVGISRVRVAVADAARSLDFYRRILGETMQVVTDRNRSIFEMNGVTIELISSLSSGDPLAAIWPDPSGRADYMATLTLRTVSLTATVEFLRANGVAGIVVGDDRVFVPAASAFNTGLEFIQG